MNVALNPHVAAMMFLEVYEIFYKNLFSKIFKTEWTWMRIEFQSRGSIHIHGFFKMLEPKPGI